MIYITYRRVSTDKQGVRGLGMSAQDEMVERHISQTRGVLLADYVEVESGRNNSRPQLALALAHCKASGATLLIAKLDRLARNVHFVSGLMESKVDFVAADMPTANRLTIHIMAAFAEHEAAMISERTKAALAQSTKKLGGFRPRAAITPEKRELSLQTRRKSARVRADNLFPMIQVVRGSGVTTLCGIAAALNTSQVKAPRGGSWTATQVSRIEALV